MKKKMIVVALLMALMTGCNRQIGDTFNFEKAYVLEDGVWKEIEVSSWKDYTDSDNIQVTDKEGNTYYSGANNIVLKKER